jgi:hypothetical protein
MASMSPSVERRPQPSKLRYVLLGITALLAWLGIGLDFLIHIMPVARERPTMVFMAFRDFVAYFTILANLLVCLVLTSAFRRWKQTALGTLLHPITTGAALVYIVLVALVYNAVLRFDWQPTGLHRMSAELMHSLVPVLYIVYWATLAPRMKLSWRTAVGWTVPPLAYGALLLFRAHMTGVQPYPFLAADNGGTTIAGNVAAITLLIVCIGLAVIAVARALAKRPEPAWKG